jgi:pimeloyl-ACP methyl ester carboxylesterase
MSFGFALVLSRFGLFGTVTSVPLDDVLMADGFDWNGSTVRWSCFGQGPPVVLCHGTPWSSYVWRTTIEALSDERSVFVWDMIAYGQSDKPDGDVSRGKGNRGEMDVAKSYRFGALRGRYSSREVESWPRPITSFPPTRRSSDGISSDRHKVRCMEKSMVGRCTSSKERTTMASRYSDWRSACPR